MQTKSVTQYRLAPCVMPRLISHIKKCKLLNAYRDGNTIILFFFGYIPDKINYLREGCIKFIYITKEFMHYTYL